MIAVAILTLVLGCLGIWCYVFYNYYKHIKVIPSPPIWPFIGNMLEFKTTKETLEILQNLFQRYNTKCLRLHIGFRTMIMCRDYKMLERILSSQTLISKGVGYAFFERWLGLGLLTSDGEKWRKRRKMITPTFHFQILEQFVDIFNAKGQIMIDKMRRDVGNPSTDVFPYVTLCALDIICETAMGTCVNAQNEEFSEYAQCVKDMGRIIQKRGLNPLQHSDFLYQFSALYKEEQHALGVLHGYTDSVIQKRRQQLLVEDESKLPKFDDTGRKTKTAFLDMLLQATIDGVPLTDRDIRSEVDTFMFEGHDTTAAGISYALYNLANHPTCQQKAFQELKDIFGDDKDKECTHKDLQEMKYLDLIIKETLRLYPSVPVYGRKTTEDFNYDGLTFPKGMTIGIFAFGIHRDPDYFPEPEKFKPERFSPENYDGKQPFAYIPFSAGPRNCIGQKFAMMEMKATISKVLRHFELTPAVPAHHLQLTAETILKSLNGVKISLMERTY